MKSARRWVAVVLALTLPGSASIAAAETRVPQGAAPRIDGTLSRDEWGGARVERLSDGGELLLLSSGDFLFVGIRAREPGITSIGRILDDEISILHASHALGTAAYRRVEDGWRLAREFDWCCRGETEPARLREEQDGILGRDDWVASTSDSGTAAHMEFKIRWPSRGLHLLISHASMPDFDRVASWPPDVQDASTTPALIRGELSRTATFATERWGLLRPEPAR